MKKLFVVLLALACMLTLAACGCEHEWEKADCSTPKTCTLCGETEGEALGHEWEDADCITAKTCTWCGTTEGDALGHEWQDATCAAPKTCLSCGETEGEALEHTWQEATTEAPKTCTLCGATEGERIITDERFTTAAAKDLFGKWESEMVITGADMGMDGFNGELKCAVEMTFGTAGEMEISVALVNTDEFKTAMTAYLVDSMYAEFSAQGLGKEDADAAMLSYYGMNTADYCAAVVETMDFESLFGDLGVSGVYYVADGKIYSAESWTGTMDPSTYTLENGKLTIDEMALAEGDPMTFTQVVE